MAPLVVEWYQANSQLLQPLRTPIPVLGTFNCEIILQDFQPI